MSVAYAFLLLILGLTICGGLIVGLQQILGIKFHFLAINLGLSATGLQTLGYLDDFLGWLPIAVTIAAVSGLIIVSYRARYQL